MRKVYIFGIIALIAIIIGYAWAEQITLTTYYPSPYGVYKEFTTTSKTSLATNYMDFGADFNSRVGIGTTSPESKLHVQGQPSVGNVGFGRKEFATGLGTGDMWYDGGNDDWFMFTHIGDTAGGMITFSHYDGVGIDNIMAIRNDARVGIGTISPGPYDTETIAFEVGANPNEGYVAVDDVWIKNPKSGVAADWASNIAVGAGVGFGVWNDRNNDGIADIINVGQNYLAATDGIVCAFFGPAGSGGLGPSLQGFTDSNPIPSTVVQYSAPYNQMNVASITFPVRKGDYWRVESAGPAFPNPEARWMPIGN